MFASVISMKASVAIIAALICSCTGLEQSANLQQRNADVQANALRSDSGTCSIGIARLSGSISWDATVYNTPQYLRQDINVIAKIRNAQMDKGQSTTITGLAQDITITNVDNAPAFDYIVPLIQAPISDPNTGKTKVLLKFEIPDAGLTWTTEDCGAGSVVFSAGRESWSCDFPC